MNHTKNYDLPQWELNDLIKMEDFNSAMANIENGIDGAKAESKAGEAELQRQVNSANAKAENAQSVANAAQNAANRKPYVVGSYSGNNADQTIYLGFRPSFLIISGMLHHGGNSPDMFTNYTAITGGHVLNNEVYFTDTGFTVTKPGHAPLLSLTGKTYDYIAFK